MGLVPCSNGLQTNKRRNGMSNNYLSLQQRFGTKRRNGGGLYGLRDATTFLFRKEKERGFTRIEQIEACSDLSPCDMRRISYLLNNNEFVVSVAEKGIQFGGPSFDLESMFHGSAVLILPNRRIFHVESGDEFAPKRLKLCSGEFWEIHSSTALELINAVPFYTSTQQAVLSTFTQFEEKDETPVEEARRFGFDYTGTSPTKPYAIYLQLILLENRRYKRSIAYGAGIDPFVIDRISRIVRPNEYVLAVDQKGHDTCNGHDSLAHVCQQEQERVVCGIGHRRATIVVPNDESTEVKDHDWICVSHDLRLNAIRQRDIPPLINPQT